MMNRNERMNKLNAMGINTGKYFNVNLPEGLKPGATISLVISEDGQPMIVGGCNDIIREQIIEDGYVKNTKLHRRFVMAQMCHMLNYKSWDGKQTGYNEALKRYDYKYTLDMMIEEVRVLSKLETRDKESLEERSHFFNKDVVIEVLNDYLDKLIQHVDSLPNKNCKGVPYKRIKGMNIFCADIDKKLYRPIRDRIWKVKRATDYSKIYKELATFMRYEFVKLPYNTAKSKAWIDAYKGEGAYYTLKNLVMFHDCAIYEKYYTFKGAEAVHHLQNKLVEYRNEGWRMFALMKKVIADNDFDFNKRMAELGK